MRATKAKRLRRQANAQCSHQYDYWLIKDMAGSVHWHYQSQRAMYQRLKRTSN